MKNLLKSFVYAFKGIVFCIANERNFRIHLCFLAFMFGFLTLRDFFVVSKTQFAILALTSAAVISLELVNTAVEKAVDLACGEKKHSLAKIAKDACAGSVLVSAIAAVIIGVLILYQPDAFSAMYAYYKSNFTEFALLIASVAAGFAFVFAGPKKIAGLFTRRSKK